MWGGVCNYMKGYKRKFVSSEKDSSESEVVNNLSGHLFKAARWGVSFMGTSCSRTLQLGGGFGLVYFLERLWAYARFLSEG